MSECDQRVREKTGTSLHLAACTLILIGIDVLHSFPSTSSCHPNLLEIASLGISLIRTCVEGEEGGMMEREGAY